VSGLSDAARDARAHADVCLDKGCHAVALALEAAVDAEFAAIRDAERAEPDLTGIPDSAVKNVLIPRPGTQN
jgi:hypothetical protein